MPGERAQACARLALGNAARARLLASAEGDELRSEVEAFAVAEPEPIRVRLSMLRAPLAGAKWIEPDNMHITVRFAGDIDGRTADELVDFLAGVRARPFEVMIKGVGRMTQPSVDRRVKFSLNDNVSGLRAGDDARVGGLKLGIVATGAVLVTA